MTDATEAKPRAQVPMEATREMGAIVPQNMDEMARFATMVCKSGMAPKGLETPEKVAIAVMKGLEVGFTPFQSLADIAVINGRPTIWGDGLIALVRREGHQVHEWLEGEGDAMVASCTVKRADTGEEITRSFSVADAKKASLWGKQGPWQQYPKRMLQMRARGWAVRDGAADAMKGLRVAEEERDHRPIRDVTPESDAVKRLKALRAGTHDPAAPGIIEPEDAPQVEEPATGEVQIDPNSEAFKEGAKDYGDWGPAGAKCPYDDETAEAAQWWAGWRKAREDAGEAEE